MEKATVIVTDEVAVAEPDQVDKSETINLNPAKVRMLRPFGYVDGMGHHYWQKGQMVDDPVEIAMLIDRKCVDYEEVK